MSKELDQLMTVPEIAQALRIGKSSVNKLLANGTLPKVKILDRTMARASDVARLMQPAEHE